MGEPADSSESAVFPVVYCAALSGFLDTALSSGVRADSGPVASGPYSVDYVALVFSLVGSWCRSSLSSFPLI